MKKFALMLAVLVSGVALVPSPAAAETRLVVDPGSIINHWCC